MLVNFIIFWSIFKHTVSLKFYKYINYFKGIPLKTNFDYSLLLCFDCLSFWSFPAFASMLLRVWQAASTSHTPSMQFWMFELMNYGCRYFEMLILPTPILLLDLFLVGLQVCKFFPLFSVVVCSWLHTKRQLLLLMKLIRILQLSKLVSCWMRMTMRIVAGR